MHRISPDSAASHMDYRICAALAGTLYLVVIAAGLSAEFAIRQPLIVPGDAAATAGNIRASAGLFRAGFALDAAMALADVGLAVALFLLFRSVQPGLALAAMVFRLVQAAVLAMNLLFHTGALQMALGGGSDTAVLWLVETQAAGYDLGLIFFGVNCLLMATLIRRSGFAPRGLGVLVGLAGVVYLTGSFTRFLAPEMLALMQPAYVLPMAAEIWFCGWLLWTGFGRTRAAVAA
ncbi:DUF4386 domain-containing protein [Pseudoruegeria sp. HB172150]|uniref:DUF4386 domain-containing protein n=1 Tax=Pseudoruegeria sp. HB172150 TaxID=2721164 RepID=UPI0020A63AC5|nr:DUF4386 domain-containing protein [Pseudoruegeria sp. HB172150]